MRQYDIHDPTEAYVHLAEDAAVRVEHVTPDFWRRIGERPELHTGRLVSGVTTGTDWDSWEVHPHGDELIVVTEGACRFHLDDGGQVTEHLVTAPEYVIVPAGVWHTMDAVEPGRALIITWGDGTRHRPR